MSFSLATSESWRDRNTGEHRIVLFWRFAEAVQPYARGHLSDVPLYGDDGQTKDVAEF